MTTAPMPTVTDSTAVYWQQAAVGRFVLPKCRECKRFHHHPRPWCPYCWAADLDWQEPSGKATIVTYTVVRQAPSPAFTAPYVLAIVELEEGPRMMANVIECNVDEVRVGMAVEVVFESRGNLALPQFRRVTSTA